MSAAPSWPADKVERRPIAALVPYAQNARTHSPEQIAQLAASIQKWGWTIPVLIDEAGQIIAGHGRVLAAKELGIDEIPVMIAAGWSEDDRRAYVLADNQLALNAGWDDDVLRAEIAALAAGQYDLPVIGFDADELARLLGEPEPENRPEQKAIGALAAQFMIPPFSVLNAREGWWQDRKRAWLALGIQSELGRGADMAFQSQDSLTKLRRGGGQRQAAVQGQLATIPNASAATDEENR